MTVTMKQWVCETCGISWEEEAGIEPLRDEQARVMCEDCYAEVDA